MLCDHTLRIKLCLVIIGPSSEKCLTKLNLRTRHRYHVVMFEYVLTMCIIHSLHYPFCTVKLSSLSLVFPLKGHNSNSLSLPSKQTGVCEVWTCVCACMGTLAVEVCSLCKIYNSLNRVYTCCLFPPQALLFINMLNRHAGIGLYLWVVNGLLYELAFTIDSRKIKRFQGSTSVNNLLRETRDIPSSISEGW